MTSAGLVTADELIRMPDDGFRYELIRGMLKRMPYNGGEHGAVGSELCRRLGNHVVNNQLGQGFIAAGFIFETNPDTVLAPDLTFVHTDRLPPKEDRIGYLRIPPDLAVEIIDPREHAVEFVEKAAGYLAFGVKTVWVIEPRLRTVTIYEADRHPRVLVAGDMLEGGDVVPGFQMPVADLFR